MKFDLISFVFFWKHIACGFGPVEMKWLELGYFYCWSLPIMMFLHVHVRSNTWHVTGRDLTDHLLGYSNIECRAFSFTNSRKNREKERIHSDMFHDFNPMRLNNPIIIGLSLLDILCMYEIQKILLFYENISINAFSLDINYNLDSI